MLFVKGKKLFAKTEIKAAILSAHCKVLFNGIQKTFLQQVINVSALVKIDKCKHFFINCPTLTLFQNKIYIDQSLQKSDSTWWKMLAKFCYQVVT